MTKIADQLRKYFYVFGRGLGFHTVWTVFRTAAARADRGAIATPTAKRSPRDASMTRRGEPRISG